MEVRVSKHPRDGLRKTFASNFKANSLEWFVSQRSARYRIQAA
jgi:hypothetical protein